MTRGNPCAGIEGESHLESESTHAGGKTTQNETTESAVLPIDATIRVDGANAPMSQVAESDTVRESAATTEAVVTGAPIAQHDTLHAQLPADISDRPPSAAHSVDAPSIGSLGQPSQPTAPASGANDDDEIGLYEPVQEAQLAEEQELEADVRLPFNNASRGAAGVILVTLLNMSRLADRR